MADPIHFLNSPQEKRPNWWERGILWFDQFVSPETAYKINRYSTLVGFIFCLVCFWIIFHLTNSLQDKTFILKNVGLVTLLFIAPICIQGLDWFAFGDWNYHNEKVARTGCGCLAGKLIPYGTQGWLKNRLGALFYCTIGRSISYFGAGFSVSIFVIFLFMFLAIKTGFFKI